MKKLSCLFIIASFLYFTTAFAHVQSTITDYHAAFFPRYNQQNELRIVLRIYYRHHNLYYLVVNPYTFATETALANHFTARKSTDDTPITMQMLKATPYVKALEKYTSPPYHSQNDGITHTETPVNGFFLTADMCPALKPFEASFFDTLVNLSEKTQSSYSRCIIYHRALDHPSPKRI